MKRFVWLGLTMLTLSLVAAQCGATAPNNADADPTQSPAEVAQKPEAPDTPAPTQTVPLPTEAEHPATCTDPFEGQSVQFTA
jgi:hypothetical protein